jgi:hypothetical protein
VDIDETLCSSIRAGCAARIMMFCHKRLYFSFFSLFSPWNLHCTIKSPNCPFILLLFHIAKFLCWVLLWNLKFFLISPFNQKIVGYPLILFFKFDSHFFNRYLFNILNPFVKFNFILNFIFQSKLSSHLFLKFGHYFFIVFLGHFIYIFFFQFHHFIHDWLENLALFFSRWGDLNFITWVTSLKT